MIFAQSLISTMLILLIIAFACFGLVEVHLVNRFRESGLRGVMQEFIPEDRSYQDEYGEEDWNDADNGYDDGYTDGFDDGYDYGQDGEYDEVDQDGRWTNKHRTSQ